MASGDIQITELQQASQFKATDVIVGNDSSDGVDKVFSGQEIKDYIASDYDPKISAKLDKSTGKSLMDDTELTRLSTVTNQTKTSLGLDNVDNTSDANKPISTAQQTALNGKQPTLTQAQQDALSAAESLVTNGDGSKVLHNDGTYKTPSGGSGGTVDTSNHIEKTAVKQTTGTSTTDIMSQKAVTDELINIESEIGVKISEELEDYATKQYFDDTINGIVIPTSRDFSIEPIIEAEINQNAITDSKIGLRSVADQVADSNLVATNGKYLTTWLQNIRNNLKYILESYDDKEDISNKVNIGSTATSDEYPNAKSVWDFIQDVIATIPAGGLKVPISLDLESNLPTTGQKDGDYYFIEDMDETMSGHTGRAWWNSATSTTDWQITYDQYYSADGESVILTGGGALKVSTTWLNEMIEGATDASFEELRDMIANLFVDINESELEEYIDELQTMDDDVFYIVDSLGIWQKGKNGLPQQIAVGKKELAYYTTENDVNAMIVDKAISSITTSISTGSTADIRITGLYYLSNAVTDLPTTNSGVMQVQQIGTLWAQVFTETLTANARRFYRVCNNTTPNPIWIEIARDNENNNRFRGDLAENDDLNDEKFLLNNGHWTARSMAIFDSLLNKPIGLTGFVGTLITYGNDRTIGQLANTKVQMFVVATSSGGATRTFIRQIYTSTSINRSSWQELATVGNVFTPQGNQPSDIDLNTLTHVGSYAWYSFATYNSIINKPSNAPSSRLATLFVTSGTVGGLNTVTNQRFVVSGSGENNMQYQVWERQLYAYQAGAWSAWKLIATDDWVAMVNNSGGAPNIAPSSPTSFLNSMLTVAPNANTVVDFYINSANISNMTDLTPEILGGNYFVEVRRVTGFGIATLNSHDSKKHFVRNFTVTGDTGTWSGDWQQIPTQQSVLDVINHNVGLGNYRGRPTTGAYNQTLNRWYKIWDSKGNIGGSMNQFWVKVVHTAWGDRRTEYIIGVRTNSPSTADVTYGGLTELRTLKAGTVTPMVFKAKVTDNFRIELWVQVQGTSSQFFVEFLDSDEVSQEVGDGLQYPMPTADTEPTGLNASVVTPIEQNWV